MTRWKRCEAIFFRMTWGRSWSAMDFKDAWRFRRDRRWKKRAGYWKLAAHAPFILGVVGCVDLRSARVRIELESLARYPKLVGVRHIVQSEPDERFLLQPDFLRGIAMLEEFNLAYDILVYARHLSA